MNSLCNLTIEAPALSKKLIIEEKVDTSVSERVCGGLTCRSPGSMSDKLDNQQHHGPTTTVARLTPHLLFSLLERKTSHNPCVHTYPLRAVWCLSLRSHCKCRVHLASGVSHGAAFCRAGAQIKGCRRQWRRAQYNGHCCPLPWAKCCHLLT